MKKDNLNSFKSVFDSILKEKNLEKPYDEARLRSEWASVIGEEIASKTTKIYISNQILYIEIDSPSQKNDLTYQKKEITSKINTLFPAIKVKKLIIL